MIDSVINDWVKQVRSRQLEIKNSCRDCDKQNRHLRSCYPLCELASLLYGRRCNWIFGSMGSNSDNWDGAIDDGERALELLTSKGCY